MMFFFAYFRNFGVVHKKKLVTFLKPFSMNQVLIAIKKCDLVDFSVYFKN